MSTGKLRGRRERRGPGSSPPAPGLGRTPPCAAAGDNVTRSVCGSDEGTRGGPVGRHATTALTVRGARPPSPPQQGRRRGEARAFPWLVRGHTDRPATTAKGPGPSLWTLSGGADAQSAGQVTKSPPRLGPPASGPLPSTAGGRARQREPKALFPDPQPKAGRWPGSGPGGHVCRPAASLLPPAQSHSPHWAGLSLRMPPPVSGGAWTKGNDDPT